VVYRSTLPPPYLSVTTTVEPPIPKLVGSRQNAQRMAALESRNPGLLPKNLNNPIHPMTIRALQQVIDFLFGGVPDFCCAFQRLDTARILKHPCFDPQLLCSRGAWYFWELSSIRVCGPGLDNWDGSFAENTVSTTVSVTKFRGDFSTCQPYKFFNPDEQHYGRFGLWPSQRAADPRLVQACSKLFFF